ncbi:MAG TPA: hypothetical protein VFQ96_01745 [Microbacteriaceae bacterium]|nr:hypothetical protein [Microbacteriaceae bacterium]
MKAKISAAIAVAACVYAAAAWGAATDPRPFVLRPADFPSGFQRNAPHYVSKRLAAKGVPPKTFARFGYVNGYSVVYNKTGTALLGILRAQSNATVYQAPGGAHAAMRYVEANVESTKKFPTHRLAVGVPLGNEARIYKVTEKSSKLSADVVVVLWRSGRVLSTVTASGISGTVDPAQVEILALRQQRHISGK